MSPSQPLRSPRTSIPKDCARRTTARITAFSPGQSPPPVKMPIFFTLTARKYKLRCGAKEAQQLRILAVDTTTAWGSVALVEGGVVRGEVRLRATAGHSLSAMPSIAFLLEALGIGPAAVEAYAVAAGPGSFTGLRIGIGTVQGLALAAGRPCLGTSALDVLAARAAGAAPRVVAMMDAGRDEVYAGVYDAVGRRLGDAQAAPPETVAADAGAGAAFFGDGALRYEERIRKACPDAVFPRRSLFLAGTLGLLAEPRLAAGEGVTAGELRALYLRPPHIRP